MPRGQQRTYTQTVDGEPHPLAAVDLSSELEDLFQGGYDDAVQTIKDLRGLEEVVARLPEAARQYAAERAGELITNIDDTTRETVADMVASAQEDGLSDTELAAQLQEAGLFGDSRAELIARTEGATAWNMGTLSALRDAGEDYVYVSDPDECGQEECDVDGEIWTIDEAEAEPLGHPNCGRDFRPLTDDELADVQAEEGDTGEEGIGSFAQLFRQMFYSEDQARDDHGRWTTGGGGEKAPQSELEKHLIDYKPGDRALTGPQSRDITEVVPGTSHVNYLSVPGVEQMHDIMGLHPTLETNPRDYVDARDKAFDKAPQMLVPVTGLTFTQPRVNEPRLHQIIQKPYQFELPVQVLSSGGRMYLMNGHHRVAAAYLAGRSHVPAHVLSVGTYKPAARIAASATMPVMLAALFAIDPDELDVRQLFYSEDQPRDDHGRFEGDASSPESIARSLGEAERATSDRLSRLSSQLDAKPEGHQIKAGRRTYTHQIVGGDHFWTPEKGATLTSRQMVEQAGTGLVTGGHVSHEDYYGHKFYSDSQLRDERGRFADEHNAEHATTPDQHRAAAAHHAERAAQLKREGGRATAVVAHERAAQAHANAAAKREGGAIDIYTHAEVARLATQKAQDASRAAHNTERAGVEVGARMPRGPANLPPEAHRGVRLVGYNPDTGAHFPYVGHHGAEEGQQFYSPDQPRDDHGRFEGGGAAPEDEHRAALRESPLMGLEHASEIRDAFYKDMGWNLDQRMAVEQAVDRYNTGSGCHAINGPMRDPAMKDTVLGEKWRESFDKLLTALPDVQGDHTFYRAMSLSNSSPLAQTLRNIGGVYNEKAFTSATASEAYVHDWIGRKSGEDAKTGRERSYFLLEWKNEGGAKNATAWMGMGDREAEVNYRPGARFTVEKVTHYPPSVVHVVGRMRP